jgi:hypothetical protein
MKHIKLFELDSDDILGDLEKIGFEPYVGYIWCEGTRYNPLGFVVVGKDEQDCVDQLRKHLPNYLVDPSKYSTSGPGTSSGGFGGAPREIKTMSDYLAYLFEAGQIRDAGHYALKARKNEAFVKIFWDEYMMNPKYVYDQAQEYFTNADYAFSRDLPQDKIYPKK